MRTGLGYLLARLQWKLRRPAIANSYIHASSKVQGSCQIVDSHMDRYSYCGYECRLLNCSIGAFCSIADNVYVGGASHPMQFVSMSPVFLRYRHALRKKFADFGHERLPHTTIGSDVWIGFGAMIRAGVNIGHGAVIGMGAVVTKDIEPYTVVAGNPARIIRKRFGTDVISGLLQSRWWDKSDEELHRLAPRFNNPAEFLKSVENR